MRPSFLSFYNLVQGFSHMSDKLCFYRWFWQFFEKKITIYSKINVEAKTMSSNWNCPLALLHMHTLGIIVQAMRSITKDKLNKLYLGDKPNRVAQSVTDPPCTHSTYFQIHPFAYAPFDIAATSKPITRFQKKNWLKSCWGEYQKFQLPNTTLSNFWLVHKHYAFNENCLNNQPINKDNKKSLKHNQIDCWNIWLCLCHIIEQEPIEITTV